MTDSVNNVTLHNEYFTILTVVVYFIQYSTLKYCTDE